MIMIHIKKIYAWCVQHWRWLVFGLVALIAYLSGRKNARALWQQAELARKHYKKEAEAIEKAHAEKKKKTQLAEAAAKKALSKAESKKIKAEKDLSKKKRKEALKLVKDQDAIDKELKNLGIDEV